jgi:hypothetical protein
MATLFAVVPRYHYHLVYQMFSCAGESAIKHLLSRGTHREFGYAALLVMLVFYFSGAVWAAGSAIASGLFVPMLLIGSCVGRIVGLIAVDIAAKWGHGSPGYAPIVATAKPMTILILFVPLLLLRTIMIVIMNTTTITGRAVIVMMMIITTNNNNNSNNPIYNNTDVNNNINDDNVKSKCCYDDSYR